MNHENSIDILLVEDSMDDAELAIRELKKHNMANNLIHVTDGEQAINFMFGEGEYANRVDIAYRPKLVLLDIQMPKLNGIEVLRKIKEDERTRSTVVVILTSSREDPDIRRCYDLGVNSYIVKPVNFDNFAESIKNLGFYWLLINEVPTTQDDQ